MKFVALRPHKISEALQKSLLPLDEVVTGLSYSLYYCIVLAEPGHQERTVEITHQ